MSNFLAIATVTEAVRQMLERAIKPDFTGSLNEATATAMRPNSGATGLPTLGVNLYLYQVSYNTAFRNADLPTRNNTGVIQQKPRAALDLHYLFSFYGEEGKLEPQQVMGSVIRTLHASPLLMQKEITHIIETSDHLKKSDLDSEIERIKLTPLPLTIEELSKIWSVFFQNSFTLSMAYTASVVFIEGKELPTSSLPVKARNIYALPVSLPVIDGISSQAGTDDPLVPNQRFLTGERLVLTGRQLRGDKTAVRIDEGEIISSQILEVKNKQITLLLPADLPAGIHSISVAHKLMIGDPPAEHSGVESNSSAFLLCPSIAVPAGMITPVAAPDNGKTIYTTSIPIGLVPACGRNQHVVLLLNEYQENSAAPPVIYRIGAPESNGITNPSVSETGAIVFVMTTSTKPKAGKYFARVQVDGAGSSVNFEPPVPLVAITDVP
jgi:hypothetical protein